MTGLSSREAAHRLSQHGPNELPSARRRGVWSILLRVLQEPMLLLLVACGAIYSISGEFRDGALLFGSAVLVVAITLYQEVKSERALDALRNLASPRALVIRDGKARRIPGREVVPGDLLQIFEGDRVPADSVLVSAAHLSVDESLLTGESFSVSKFPRAPGAPSMSENKLYSGSMVVAGQGFAEVLATGQATELGKIGKSLGEAREQPTELQRELNRMIRAFGVVSIGFSLAIAITYGLTRGDWIRGILAGLAAAMSLLPEEFPVVMTVFLAMGAWRISRRNVLTRRMAAIEALGSVSALCVDKTGTLTQNRMIVRDALGDDSARIRRIAALACNPTPIDPMEKAILEARGPLPEPDPALTLEKQYPLSTGLLAMSMAWKNPDGGPRIVACKGAPEAVIRLCGLAPKDEASLLESVKRLASEGRRVLAVAESSIPGPLPETQEELGLRITGLIGLEDPIRPDVPAAIAECSAAGIRVLMLTGDYPETARSIASQLGLDQKQVLSGAEIADMDDLRLQEAVRDCSVYARVSPDQKLRIVMALKAREERVAMTGDGVNDAPSLKWADIGVAMGERGTDVAREAASIVLLDDSFASMVAAIRLGRRIYDNIRKAVLFIFAIHIPIAGLAILPVIFKLPLLLLPAHIVFLELIIDPACSLVYEAEAEEPGVMKRPPRPKDASIFSLRDLGMTALQGLAILALVFALYVGSLRLGHPAEEARALAFLSLTLCNLGLILVNRRPEATPLRLLQERNRAFDFVATGALALLIAVISLPGLREVFSFSPLGPGALALASVTGLVSLAISGAVAQLGFRKSLGEGAHEIGLGQDSDQPLS